MVWGLEFRDISGMETYFLAFRLPDSRKTARAYETDLAYIGERSSSKQGF